MTVYVSLQLLLLWLAQSSSILASEAGSLIWCWRSARRQTSKDEIYTTVLKQLLVLSYFCKTASVCFTVPVFLVQPSMWLASSALNCGSILNLSLYRTKNIHILVIRCDLAWKRLATEQIRLEIVPEFRDRIHYKCIKSLHLSLYAIWRRKAMLSVLSYVARAKQQSTKQYASKIW